MFYGHICVGEHLRPCCRTVSQVGRRHGEVPEEGAAGPVRMTNGPLAGHRGSSLQRPLESRLRGLGLAGVAAGPCCVTCNLLHFTLGVPFSFLAGSRPGTTHLEQEGRRPGPRP